MVFTKSTMSTKQEDKYFEKSKSTRSSPLANSVQVIRGNKRPLVANLSNVPSVRIGKYA